MLTLAAVVFNIFIIRQTFSFVFLSFVPGFLLLKFFKIDNLGFLKNLLLSAGLSLAFLMFFGLLLNTLLPLMGVQNPLSTFNIVASVSLVIFPLSLILYKKEKPTETSITSIKLPVATILLLTIAVLTVIGAELANASNYTLVLMFLTIATMLVVLCIFSKRLFPLRIYPLALYVIAFFLLIGTSLASNYLLGADIQTEAYFATLTSVNSFWNHNITHPFNGMLSVTILPTIFSKFMNFDIAWTFKLGYPLIYALVPIALYLGYRKQTSPLVAFLAVFFFMSMDTFYLQMLGLARQMVAELFLALLILLLVEERLSTSKKRGLFLIFGVSLIVSHYSTAYVFAFYIMLTLLFQRFFARTDHKSAPVITPAIVAGYLAATLGWDLLVSPSAFNSLEVWLTYVSRKMFELSQPPGITGLLPTYLSPLHNVSKYLFLVLQGFIALGFIGLLVRRKTSRLNKEYSVMCVGSFAILLMTILIPSFATAGLNETRFYHIALFFLAPLCITGLIFVVGLFAKIKVKVFPPVLKFHRSLSKNFKRGCLFFMAILLVSFFALQSGFVYEITGDVPTSLSLSMNRQGNWTLYLNQLYIKPQEVTASKWLSTYRDNQAAVYGDSGSRYLTSYGLINPANVSLLDPSIQGLVSSPSYYVFGTFNLEEQKVEGWSAESNLSSFSFIQNGTDLIYSNGGSVIYYGK